MAWRRGIALAGLAAASLFLGASSPADWLAPQEPFRIADNLYYVGSADVGVYLIKTPKGLIVLDGGYGPWGPVVLDHIRKLGFDPKDIKVLLNSHAHADHAGGLAALKAAAPGAKLYAAPRDAPLLENGGHDDPALGNALTFDPVHVDHLLKDGETVSLGGAAMTAHFTPGHTRGCTTWTLPVTVDGKARTALFACSFSVLPMMRLAGPQATWPGIAGDYEGTFRTLRALPCDIFLGAHAGFFGMAGKRAKQTADPKGPNPFYDPAGCKAYIDAGEKTFRTRLAADSK